jgi:hypothetical protein
MRHRPSIAPLLACVALGTACGAAADPLVPLFHIAKSDTRNEIHYAARVDADCRLAADAVQVFWLRRGDAARPPRPLDWLEDALVYGVRVIEASAGRIVFTLAADDTRPVRLEAQRGRAGCSVQARLRVLGAWAEPVRAFVEIREAGKLIPEVSHVDLHARREDGRPVCERLSRLRGAGAPCPP